MQDGHLVAQPVGISNPQGSSFLAIACVEVIGRVDELGCRESWLLPPLPALVERFKLLLPDRAQRLDGRQRVHPVGSAGSIQRMQESPAVGSHLIGIVLPLFLLLGQAFMFKSFTIALNPLSRY